jgi:hypothetical protein
MKPRYAIPLILLGVVVPAAIIIDEIWLNIYFRVIPLSTVSSTFGPSKSHRVPDAPRRKIGNRLKTESDVFLVRGDDLSAALDATERRVLENAPADVVIAPKGNPAHKGVWIAIYLGAAGSSPPRWRLDSIRMEGRLICVRFSDAGGGHTDDIHAYWAWAPLGELSPGTYSVSLINTSTNETLQQTIEVGEP